MAQSAHYPRHDIFYYLLAAILLPVMLLAPAINIPVPESLRFLDAYVSLFFILHLLLSGFPRTLEIISKTPILTLLALTALMLGMESIFSIGDSTGILLSIRSIASILAAIGCSLLLWKTMKESALRFFFKVVICCAIAQGLILWLSFFSADFRDLMSLFLHRQKLEGAEHLILMRVPGFASSGGDGLSLNHGLLCVVATMGIFYLYPSSLKRTLLLGVTIAANTGSAFTGRSGLYIGSFFIAVIILTYRNGKLRAKRGSYFLLFVAFLAMILLIFSSQIGAYGLELRDEYGYEYPVVRLLEGFIAMISDGAYEDRTILLLLQEMFFFPQDPLRLLIGNNDFGQMPVNYIESDVGYVRMIHGFGVFGMLGLLIGVYIIPVWAICRSKSGLQRCFIGNTKEIAEAGFLTQVVLVIFIFGVVSHWKIFYLSTRIYLFVLFVFLSLTYLKINSMRKRSLALTSHPKSAGENK